MSLDPKLHAGGTWYSDTATESLCLLPVTIQNNRIVGTAAKVIELWMYKYDFISSLYKVYVVVVIAFVGVQVVVLE